MDTDLFKLIGIIVFTGFIIYFIIKGFSLQISVIEGLTNADGTTTTSAVPSNGEAGTAASYSAAIKAQVVKMQDELLISKYRQDYENTIINLDDLTSYMMLKQILNLKLDSNDSSIAAFQNLNILKNAKDSLNSSMKFLDTQ